MRSHLLSYLFMASISIEASNKYVRKGATGSGTGADWTNAYSELSSVSFTGLAGFTMYIAAGSYTSGFPTMSNIDNCTIKRATVADHGTSTGWSSGYDGQVTATPGGKFLLMSSCDNVVFDGGGTKEPWLFRIVGQEAYNGMFQIDDGSSITVRYIEMDGNGCQPDIENGPEDGFRIGGPSSLIIEHNWIHNYWYCTGTGNVGHSDGVQMPSCSGAIIRYNKFQDCGMLLFFGDCTWVDQWANDVWIHHNIFIQQNNDLGPTEDNYRLQDMKGVNETSTSYLIIENNTYYRQTGFSGATLNENTDCPANTTRRIIRNNIFYNGGFGLSSGNGTVSYNCFYTGDTMSGSNNITSNPLFVDASVFNFRLQSSSPANNLGTSYIPLYGLGTVTLDYDGNTASSWYMGAFTYTSGASTVGPVTASGTVSVGTISAP